MLSGIVTMSSSCSTASQTATNGGTSPSQSDTASPGGLNQDQEPVFDGERALAHIRAQVGFGPRNPGSEGHRACLDYLAAELAKVTDSVERQEFTHRSLRTFPGQSFEMTNVIGTIESSAGSDAPKMLLCAHWDTRPVADHDPDPANRSEPILGANDGASDRPIRGILLDMIGDRDLEIVVDAYSYQADQSLMERIWQAAADLGHTDHFPTLRGPTDRVLDDHIPLIEAGVPVVDLIDFDYQYWHTLEDTVDKCSAASLQAVGETVLRVVRDGF